MEQAIEQRARAVLLGGDGVGVFHLSEDLRLADDERVEAGGDAEQLPHRLVAVLCT